MITGKARDYIKHEEPGIVLLHGDCREILPLLAQESVQGCVTSPPYWSLRDYGHKNQIGLEKTPEEYVKTITDVFSLINKVLKKDGTLWLNLGDSYNSMTGKQNISSSIHSPRGGGHKASSTLYNLKKPNSSGLKSKDLVGIPWRVAFALQADGWYLRSDIIEEVELYCPCGCGHIMEERVVRYAQDRDLIWRKPNTMPESVSDRPTKAHEYMFLMSKSGTYYYDKDAISEPMVDYEIERRLREKHQGLDTEYTRANEGNTGLAPQTGIKKSSMMQRIAEKGTKNKRSVWTIPIRPYKGAHFAVFPPELVEPCILAGSKKGDIIIDPFGGSQTVGQVCKKHGRRYIGIDINSEYLDLGPDRIGAQGVLDV